MDCAGETSPCGFRFAGQTFSRKNGDFLLNDGTAAYGDAAKQAIPKDLEVETRFIEQDGSLRF